MEKSITSFKLFRLLSSLSLKEYNALRRMSESKFFPTKPATPLLLKILKPYYPAFDSPKLTKKKLHEKLFKPQPYLDSMITNLLHDVAALTENFLIQQQLKSDERERSQLLRKIYLQRNLYKDFQLAKGRVIKKMEDKLVKAEPDFLELAKLYDQRYFFPQNRQLAKKNDDILKANDALDQFYILSKLHYAGELAIQKRLVAIDKPFIFQQELMNLDTTITPFDKAPVFQIYQKILNLYHFPEDKKNFKEIKQLLKDKSVHLTKDQQQIILIHLLNYAFHRINNKEISFKQEANDLYKLGHQQQLLVSNNIITDSTFLNVVDIASVVKDYKWAELFIKKYKKHLLPHLAENTHNLAQAAYYFFKGNFNQVLFHLEKCTPINQMYLLKINAFYMRTYYELLENDPNAYDQLFLKIDSFEHLLRRDEKIQPYKAASFFNMIFAVRVLCRIRNNPNYSKDKIQSLKAEVLAKKPLGGLDWILKKMKEL